MPRWVRAVALAGMLACGKSDTASKASCVPSDCAALGAACGAAGDGCGNVIECGACPAGETCGAGGKANVCGKGACQPATCQSRQATCGSIADGCGGTLACGDCKSGDACGAGGTANVCAPIPPTGDVSWSFAVSTPGPDYVAGAGNDGAGNRYLLSFTQNEVGATHTLRLQKLAPDGKLLSSKEWGAVGFNASGFRMAVTVAGSVYLAASANCMPWETPCTRRIDLGGGAATDSVLVKLGADGAVEWQRELTTTDVRSLAVNEQGNVLVARSTRDQGASQQLEKYQYDGALLAKVSASAEAVALDPSGNMIAASVGWVAKYSAAGALLWSRALGGGGEVSAVATTAKGTVVVLAVRTGDVAFGSSTVRSGRMVLFVLEPDAQPRFARGLAWFWPTFLAVDPTGRAAVVGTGGCGELVAEAFDLSNADLWRRFLPDGGKCWPGLWAGPAAFGADHRLFLTGSFYATLQIGGKTLSPLGQDAVGVLLDP